MAKPQQAICKLFEGRVSHPMIRIFLLFLMVLIAPAFAADTVGTMISTSAAPTIVIDAGHGGTDRGARCAAPYCEEKKISLQTTPLLPQYP